jgi:hypothetical protein
VFEVVTPVSEDAAIENLLVGDVPAPKPNAASVDAPSAGTPIAHGINNLG